VQLRAISTMVASFERLAAVVVACILGQGAAFSSILPVAPGSRAIGRPASRPTRRNSLFSWSPRIMSARPHGDLCMVQPGLSEVKSREMQLVYLGDAWCLPRRHFLPSVPGLKCCVHTALSRLTKPRTPNPKPGPSRPQRTLGVTLF